MTAILVVHEGRRWLARTLAALASSQRRPDRIIAVDTGSTDGSSELLADPLVDEVLRLPPDTGFGAAIAAAETRLPAPDAAAAAASGAQQGQVEPAAEWLWLLHDDSAPEPQALTELLAESRRSSAAVLGPKARGWHEEALLVECGLSITNSGRRYTGLEPGDRDQGQRDDVRDVLAVGSAGMLVRRDLWRRLDGFDPALPMQGDDIEFCMRARRVGERVVVVPTSVVHHREAATHRIRPAPAAPGGPSASARAAAIYTTLVHGPAWLLPVTSVLLLLRSLVAAVIVLLSEGPRRAGAELRIWGSVHLRPGQVLRARRRLRGASVLPPSALRELRPGLGEQLGTALERILPGIAGDRQAGPPGRPFGLGQAAATAAALAVVAAAATREIWMAAGPLAGGALLQPVDGSTLLTAFRAAWHDVGLGSAEPSAPYLLLLIAAAAPPVVSMDFVVQALLAFTAPLAGLSAFLALRGLTNRAARGGLAMAYGLTPAAVAPSLDGRLGSAAVAVILPWLVRMGVRIYAGTSLEGRVPPARVRTAATAALLLAAAAAFAPLVWLAASVALLVAAVLRARDALRWVWTVFIVAVPPALLWPWSWAVANDPSRIMFEAGVSSPQLVAQDPPTWRLLVLDPGTLGPWVTPLAAGLVAAAVLALMPRASRGIAVWGWLLAAVGLAGATVQTSQMFLPLGATTAQYGYAGPMLHLMAVGMVMAAAGLATALPAPQRSIARALSLLAVVGLLAGPAVLAGLWVSQLDGPLRRDDAAPVPAFVSEEAVSPAGVRTLLLQVDDTGSVRYALVNGRGARLGDADVAPPAETWRQISAAAGGLAAGVGPEPAAILADNAVGYIVADTASPELAAALDGNSALRRISTTDGRGLWRVDGLATRARVAGSLGEQPVGVLTPAERGASGRFLQTQVTPFGTGSQLLIAQFDDGGWLASVDGESVPLSGGDRVALDLPDGGPVEVAVGRDQSDRDRALLVPLAVLLLVGVLLLPRGRTETPPDPDAAGQGADEAEPEELLDLTAGGRDDRGGA